jgi:ribosomal protein S18 acetylase RimI-like enzyme
MARKNALKKRLAFSQGHIRTISKFGFLMNTVTLRKASIEDFERIASLHALSWRSAYRGILSDEYLDNDLEEERKDHWRNKLARLMGKEFVILAEDQTGLLGFAAVLDKPENGYEAFIDNLHVRPELKGRGIGKKLMRAVAMQLSSSGRNSVYLWVLKGNDAAEAFYKSRGGSPADVSTVNFGGKVVGETRFVWNTLEALLK